MTTGKALDVNPYAGNPLVRFNEANRAVLCKIAAFGCCLAVVGAAAANTIYVSAEYGSDETGDGTQSSPMKTIQAGVDKLSGWGATLYISNGIYKIDTPIDLPDQTGRNGVTVRGMSDNPEDVVIDGQNNVRCLQCNGNTKKFYGLTFQNGYSTEQGAGIYMSGTGWVVSNCVVRNCHAVASGGIYGGGLYASRGLTLRDTSFLDCSIESSTRAQGGGFAIGQYYDEPHETVSTIQNVVVSNCVARSPKTVRGGGVSINRSNVNGLVVMDCQALNTAESPTAVAGEGGGVFKLCYAENTFENVLITNCLANSHGGGFYATGSADGILHIRNCTFAANRVEARPSTKNTKGGGAMLDAAVFKVSNSHFSNNRITTTSDNTGDGAGLNLSAAEAVLRDCVVSDNATQKGQGGGFYCTAPLAVSNCVIVANSAYGKGAFQLEACKGAMMTDVYCISNTAAQFSIGRITGTSTYPNVIRNSYFTGNGGETGQWQASFSAASSSDGSPISFEYCTFVSNLVASMQSYVVTPSADNPASETSNVSISNFFIKGCVFSSNSGKPAFPKCMNTVTNITYTYADTFQAGWWTDERRMNNYNLAMLGGVLPFVDLATDRRLKSGTSFINKGVNEDWMGTGNKNGQLDLGDGTYIIGKSGAYGVMVIRNNPMPRVRGMAVDFGCFEFNSIPGLLLFVR